MPFGKSEGSLVHFVGELVVEGIVGKEIRECENYWCCMVVIEFLLLVMVVIVEHFFVIEY